MKAVLTVGIVVYLLIVSANTEGQAQKPNEVPILTVEQRKKDIEICTQNLIAIGRSIQAYHNENGDYPEWLSDLHHPKYMPNPDVLLCPADSGGGKALFSRNIDPKMPVSYGYQFHPEYREMTRENRAIYGDVIPLVRCRHHTSREFDCLNLSFAFKVYQSSSAWQYTPEDMYGTPEKAITALETGIQQQPNNGKFLYLYTVLARLYIEVGREKDAENLINRFKSVIKPDDLQAHFLLGSMLEMMNRNEEGLAVFEKLEERYPNNHNVLNKLAQIHDGRGNVERAAEYRRKADPMSEMVGEFLPDFSATDLDGKPISLGAYRGKVVLLDFWAVWCGPCIGEMPNVKKVYDTYKDAGFDIIGVSLDTDETKLRNYLKENDIPWRQIFSGKGWDSPLAKRYHIYGIPAPWLIARDGILISRNARGPGLERLVVEALTDKPTNQ